MPEPVERQKELVLNALDQFERPLLRYAKNLFNGDEEAARDAVQHTFLKLCERPLANLAGNQAPWLYTVCRNRAMDVWRRSKREPITDNQHSNAVFARETEPSIAMEKSAMLQLVRELISNLASSEREVADLWSQGFSNKEMAKITDRSEGAIRVCLHRAIKSLRANSAIKMWITADEFNDPTRPLTLAPTETGQRK